MIVVGTLYLHVPRPRTSLVSRLHPLTLSINSFLYLTFHLMDLRCDLINSGLTLYKNNLMVSM